MVMTATDAMKWRALPCTHFKANRRSGLQSKGFPWNFQAVEVRFASPHARSLGYDDSCLGWSSPLPVEADG